MGYWLLARRAALSALAVFVSLETALYVLDIPKEYKPHTVPRQFQESLGTLYSYTNTRSTSIDFVYDRNPRGYFHDGNVVQHITNSWGFRGPEVLRKAPDTERIFFLGDSVTFGEGVYFEDTYPQVFKRLAEQAKLFGNKTVDPVNLGVGGFNTAQEFLVLKQLYDAKVVPDRVVVGYNMNDADIPLFKQSQSGQDFVRHDTPIETLRASLLDEPWWARMSRAAAVVYEWQANRELTQETIAYYKGLYADDNPSWQATKDAMRQFGEFQKKTGIPVTFIVFPRLFELDRYPFKMEREKVRRELEINGLSSVYLYPYLDGYVGPELWVHPMDQHPNDVVHRITASALLDRWAMDPSL